MSKWIILQENSEGSDFSDGRIKVPASIIDIIKRRGVPAESIGDFLSAVPKTTYDPFLLQDLRASAEKILKYATEGRRICIFGDYDADGVTSATLMVSVLSHLSDNVTYYIPSRFGEGYGLNNSALDKIKADGAELVVTVDCGSTSPNEVEYAKSIGLDIIVTDHHTVSGDTPDCLFVNPKRIGSEYPFKELAGCGVAFKLAQGIERICEEKGENRFTRAELNNELDLVAISTVADVVSLQDENRTLVKYGLKLIDSNPRAGLRYLRDALDMNDKKISSDNIAFIIAPHINALGRIRNAGLAVELLLGKKSEHELRRLADEMVANNSERKGLQDDTKRMCLAELEKGSCGELFPIIYVPDGHEGVAGIVAGNLKELLYRPVAIVTATERGVLKGTGRSIPGLNMHSMLSECKEVFSRFGGHAGACGFSLAESDLDTLRNKMQSLIKARISEDPDLLTEKIYIEKELAPKEKSINFAEKLELLQPYGEGNPRPLFCIRNARVTSVYVMGSESQHVRFTVKNSDGIPVECILFRRAKAYEDIIKRGNTIHVAGQLSINEYNGRRLQIIVTDVKGDEDA